MEHAGNAFINNVTQRLTVLETDMSEVKREQCAHMNQLEALALEVHEIHQTLDGVQQEMRWNFRQLRHDRDQLTHKVDLILEALAIKT